MKDQDWEKVPQRFKTMPYAIRWAQGMHRAVGFSYMIKKAKKGYVIYSYYCGKPVPILQ